MTIKWSMQVPVVPKRSEDDVISQIITSYKDGHSLSRLSKYYKVHPSSIRNLLKKYCVLLRPRGGRNNYKNLKITKEEFLSITYRALAKKYNVSTSTIYLYMKHKKWKKKGD